MLNFIMGMCGTGKSRKLIERLAFAVKQGKKVCAIIPDQFSFEFDKILYNEIGAENYNNVEVFSFKRIAENIFLKYGAKKGIFANDMTKNAIMYLSIHEVVKNDRLNFYNRQARYATFVPQMLNMIKEFHWSGVLPENLMEKQQFMPPYLSEKIEDISLIMSEYYKNIEKLGYKNSLNDIVEAAQSASLNGYFKDVTIFIDEFQSYSADELAMLDTMIATADDVFLTLTTDDVTSKKSIFCNIPNSTYFELAQIANKYNVAINAEKLDVYHRFKSDDIAILSKNIFRPSRNKFQTSGNVHIIEAPDVYSETDFICAEIRHLVRECNCKFSEIAVISRQLDGITSIISATFERYNIPYFMDMHQPVLHKSIFLLVMSIFEIVTKKIPSTEAILRYAKTNLIGIPYAEISVLENFCYCWNIEGEMWLKDFEAVSDNSLQANELRKKIIEPLEQFKKSTYNATGKVIIQELYNLLTVIGIEQNIVEVSEEKAKTDAEILEILREEKQLWNIFIDNVNVLYDVIGDEKMTLSDFRDILKLMLSESSFAAPPQTIDAVTVASAERSKLSAPKYVFIIGVNDGVFPAAIHDSGLLSDRDKLALTECGLPMTMTVRRKIAEEQFVAYSSLSKASNGLYLCYALSNSEGGTSYPSYIIEQILEMFSIEILQRTNELGQIFYCTTKKSSYYTFVQNYNKNDEQSASIRKYLEEDVTFNNKIKSLDGINWGEDRNISDGNIVKKIFGEKLSVSASRFEDFNKCPFMFFCKKGLEIYPQKRVEIDPMQRGSVIHKCLCDVLSSFNKEDFLAAKSDALKAFISKSLKEYYVKNLGGDFGKSDRFVNAYNRLCDTIIEIILHIQEEFSQSEFVPSDFELKVSTGVLDDENLPKNAQKIEFFGIVDRVDSFEKNGKKYVRVIDYKSGDKKFDLKDTLYGINAQMLLYLFALTMSDGNKKYDGAVPAGVLYMPAIDVKSELSRYAKTEEIEKSKNSDYKMNGIILNNFDVISAMEKEEKGIFIPVKLKNNGDFDEKSCLISEIQLENLKKHISSLLTEMSDKLYAGKVEPSPLNGGVSACQNCDYSSICGGKELNKERKYSADSEVKIKNILNGVDENVK
ncbi:MAG: PD-(D/E)XK nuclease family protein [Oscillospiraceae bacterium]